MPNYDYHCPANGRTIEVFHSLNQAVDTWADLCELSGDSLGETPPQTPVNKVITAPGLSFPKTTSSLKNMGFTKLVRRDKGVYENVTAGDGEARYVNADNPKSFPDFKKKIGD